MTHASIDECFDECFMYSRTLCNKIIKLMQSRLRRVTALIEYSMLGAILNHKQRIVRMVLPSVMYKPIYRYATLRHHGATSASGLARNSEP